MSVKTGYVGPMNWFDSYLARTIWITRDKHGSECIEGEFRVVSVTTPKAQVKTFPVPASKRR